MKCSRGHQLGRSDPARSAIDLRCVAALGALSLFSLSVFAQSNPNARRGRFDAYPGQNPDEQAFVIPLSGQSGVPLNRTNHNEDLFGGQYPRTTIIEDHQWVAGRLDHVPGTPGSFGAFNNPLAYFGGAAAGTPLHVGQSYEFGFHAGRPVNGVTNADVQPTIRFRVFPKDAFTNPVVFAAYDLSDELPVPPSRWGTNDNSNWDNFVANDFQRTYELPGMMTTLRLVEGDRWQDKWGLSNSLAYTLTHVATTDAFVYVVEQGGWWQSSTNVSASMAIRVNGGVTNANSRALYAMEFEQRPPWRSVYIHDPHFDAEPLPPAYQGRTPEELAHAVSPVPDFTSPPATNLCLSLDDSPELRQHPTLDRFVEDMRTGGPERDVLTFASFVLNEIELTDALSYRDDGSYETNSINAGGVNRNALGVFLERQGSPAEICSLLVYMLRKAGIPAVYANPAPNSVKMTDARLSRLLRMQVVGAVNATGALELAGSPTTNLLQNAPRDPALIPVNYPWVAAYVPDSEQGGSNRWVHIFPWLADTEITEGKDFYEHMAPASGSDPDGVRNAWQWLDRYVRGDSNLLSLAEGNVPSAILPKYIESRLKANHPGVAPDEIGVRIGNRKNHLTRLADLPRPFSVTAAPAYWTNLSQKANIFDTLQVQIVEGTTTRADTGEMRTADLHNRRFLIRQEKTNTGTLDTEPEFSQYYGAGPFYVAGYEQEHIWGPITYQSDRDHTRDVRVDFPGDELDDSGGYFSVREDPGNWGQSITIQDVAPGEYFTFYVRYRSKANMVGHQRAKVHVDYMNDGGDFDLKFGGSVQDYPDARLILSLAPFRDTATGTNAFGDFPNNTLLNRQEIVSNLGATDQPLFVRFIHRRHKGYAGTPPPAVAGDFLDVGHKTQFQIERPLSRGDLAAICLNSGRVTDRMLDAHAQEFWRWERAMDANTNLVADPEVMQGTAAYLMGMTYYARQGRFDEALANLHKVHRVSMLADGLARFNAARSGGALPWGQFALVEPNVDMFFQEVAHAGNRSRRPDSHRPWHRDYEDYIVMAVASGSAEEHRAINTFLEDKNGVSTVRLLQLAALDPGTDPLLLTSGNYEDIGDLTLGGSTNRLKDLEPSVWAQVCAAFGNAVTHTSFTNSVAMADFARAYMTPGWISGAESPDGTTNYTGMGALIFWRGGAAALISNNRRMVDNGGFGAHKPETFFASDNFKNLTLMAMPSSSGGDPVFTLTQRDLFDQQLTDASQSFRLGDSLHGLALATGAEADIFAPSNFDNEFAQLALTSIGMPYSGDAGQRLMQAVAYYVDDGFVGTGPSYFGANHDPLGRMLNEALADPVNILTGEFYIDDVDLALPGPMPLLIRRNYGSQNLAPGALGFGWKLSQFPFIGFSTNGALAYAAEMDGSVIAYRQQSTNLNLYLPSPADNPHWSNVRGGSQGGTGNLMNSRLVRALGGTTNYTLHGADGSRREFVERSFPLTAGGETFPRTRPYMDTWLDHAGNALWFHFGEDPLEVDYGQLRRVESSSGPILNLYYDTAGRVTEIAAGDGRRVGYEYDEHGDLVGVTRPDGSEYRFEYLHGSHAVGNRTETFSHHLIVREEKPGGRLLLNAYDAQRRVTNQWATVGADLDPVRNATFTYANDFDLTNGASVSGQTTAVDAYDRATVYRYASGLITNIAEPLNRQISREWFGDSPSEPGSYPRSLKSETDRRGLLTTYRYDARGNVTNITANGDITGDGQGDVAVTSISYNENNLPVEVIGPLEHATTNAYGDATYPFLATFTAHLAPGGAPIRADAFEYTAATESGERFARGLLARQTRAAGSDDGAVTAWAYDASGHPTAQTNFAGGFGDPDIVTTFRYNARGELAEAIDAAGRATVFDYDGMGRRTWQERRDASGAAVWWTGTYYNPNGEVEWIDGPRYHPEDYVWRKYDGAGRPKEETRWRSRANAAGTGVESPSGDALYATTSFTHDLFGNLTGILDPRGNLTSMEYDALGQMTARRRHQGASESGAVLAEETFGYESGGLISGHTNALGGATLFAHTDDGKLKLRQNPDGTTESWRYRLDGRIERETHKNGSYTEYAYNDGTRTITKTLKSAANGTLKTEISAFDRRGNLTGFTDALGHATSTTFDDLDRPKTVAGPSVDSPQQTTTYSYDAAGITNIVQNALGERSVTVSDAIGRPVRTWIEAPGGAVVRQTAFLYSPDHHAVTTIEGSSSGGGAITNTVFTDVSGQPVLAVHPDGSESWARDAAGNATAYTDPLDRTTIRAFDGLNRLSSEELPDGATTTFLHDGLGSLTARILPGGLTETNAFDTAGRLTYTELLGGGSASERRTLAYHPPGDNGAGQLASWSDARGVTCAITYDASGRPATHAWSGPLPEHALTRTTAYDDRGLPNAWTETASQLGTASAVARTLDAYGQVTAETVSLDGATVAQFSQTWDAAGRRSSLAASSPEPFSWAFSHRADGALTNVTAAGESFGFTFGDHGLLLGRSRPVYDEVIGRDANGRINARSYTAGSPFYQENGFTYAADGTLTDATVAGGARTYAYDQRQHLLRETHPSGPNWHHWEQEYDTPGLGMRLSSAWWFDTPPLGQPYAGLNWYEYDYAPNVLGQRTQINVGGERSLVPVEGESLGAGRVRVSVNGVNHGFALSPEPWDDGGLWQLPGPARLFYGSGQTITAEADHPSGQYTATTNSVVSAPVVEPQVAQHFDAAGCVTNRGWSNGVSRSQDLRWDAAGRLIAVAERKGDGHGYDWAAFYDPFGRRIRTTVSPAGGTGEVGTVTVNSVYDPEVEFLELGATVSAPLMGGWETETSTAWKIYGPDLAGGYGELQGTGGMEAIVEGGEVATLLHDFNGNVIGRRELSGYWEYNSARYTAFAPRPNQILPWFNAGVSLLEATNYRGKRLEVTGFYYFGAREYDPDTGQFLSPDPFGLAAGMNRYGFCANNPVSIFDPDGRLGKNPMEGGITQVGTWLNPRIAGPHVLDLGDVGAEAAYFGLPHPDAGTSDILNLTPGIGLFKALGEAITGSDLLTGESVDPFDRLASGGIQMAILMPARPVGPLRSPALAPRALTGPFPGNPTRGLPLGTMDNVSARNWYLKQLEAIPGQIDRAQSLRNQARQAFDLRNQARVDARALMADRAKALEYDVTDPIRTWQQQIKYAYEVRGMSGSDIWEYILESATRSRPRVNAAAGLAR